MRIFVVLHQLSWFAKIFGTHHAGYSFGNLLGLLEECFVLAKSVQSMKRFDVSNQVGFKGERALALFAGELLLAVRLLLDTAVE